MIPETDAALDNSLSAEPFKIAIVKILIKLKLTSWKLSEADNLVIMNIASALTNSVYLIILDSQKLLLRIYGPNVLHLIDRDYETSVLARLAHHRIGPRLLGQFRNGRIEQWLESVEVTAQEIRDPLVSRYIARRMREFHDYVTLLLPEMGKVSAAVNLDCWIPALPKERVTPALKQFLEHIDLYRKYVNGKEGDFVFCHNDLQYGNLLRTKGDEHHCLAVIDFEYAGPNPRAFDLANHFIEWMANYHEAPSHTIDAAAYPTFQESQNFLEEYIRFGKIIDREEDPVVSPQEVKALRDSVDLWRGMSHAQWAIWGIIQALPAGDNSKLEQEEVQIANDIEARRLNRRRSSSNMRAKQGSKRAQSPLVHGMRSPFIAPVPKRTSSYKSPGYFPTVVEPIVAEEDEEDFSLGESAIAALSQAHVHQMKPAPSHPVIEDEILFDNHAQASQDWIDEDEEPGFDYIAYSKERIGLFYGELLSIGLIKEGEVPEGMMIKRLPATALQSN